MQVAPKAVITDGIFNVRFLFELKKNKVTVFGDVGFMDMAFSIIPALYKGEHCSHQKISVDTCKTLRAETKYKEDKVFIEADGELVGTLPCNISMLAGVLPVVVPQP